MSGFKTFLLRGNLVELAVAFVVGVAFAALVTSFVADIITPIIAGSADSPTSRVSPSRSTAAVSCTEPLSTH